MWQIGSWRLGQMRIHAAALTHTGNQRKTNQDFFYLDHVFPEEVHGRTACYSGKRTSLLAGIFDGFGDVGADAAHTAAVLLSQTRIAIDEAFAPQMEDFLLRANAEVLTLCQKNVRPGGSTATIALFAGQMVHICNLGDSPGYLFRAGRRISLYTADHEICYGNIISNRLTQFLGMNTVQKPLQVHFASEQLSRGDRLLLCSDGVPAELNQTELEAILAAEKSPEVTAEKILSRALTHGGRDNITILVCDIS